MNKVHVIHVLLLSALYCGAMEPQHEQPELSSLNKGKLKAIMLVGPSQSGKSTLAAALKECCIKRGHHPQMICMDNYRTDMRAGTPGAMLSYQEARQKGKTLGLRRDALDAYAQLYGFNKFIAQSLERNDRYFIITYLGVSKEARDELFEKLDQRRHELFLVKLLCSREVAQSRLEQWQTNLAWAQYKPVIDPIKDINPEADGKNRDLVSGRIRTLDDLVKQYESIETNPEQLYGFGTWQYDMALDTTQFTIERQKKAPDPITLIEEEVYVPGPEYYQIASDIVSRLGTKPS